MCIFYVLIDLVQLVCFTILLLLIREKFKVNFNMQGREVSRCLPGGPQWE